MTNTAIKKTKQSKVKTHKAESYTGIYGMHKYWAKKPYNIIRDFIKRYSNENEIVIDPFCGSGVSVIESVLKKRKAIGLDINPSAVFIAEQVLNKIPTKELKKSFERIQERIKEEINSYYTVIREGKEYLGTHFIWENGVLTEVWYENGNGKRKKTVDKPQEADLVLSSSFTYNSINHYYPTGNFFHNTRINAYRTNNLFDLFTPRNLQALALLMDAIEQEQNEIIKNALKFCFTSCVGQASKMVFVIKGRGKENGTFKTEKKEVGSWVIGYWMPCESFEINVWKCFESRFKKIFKAKQEQEGLKYEVKKTSDFNELITTDKNLVILTEAAQIGMQRIPDNSVDYVITDPPHGNRIPYLELSMMWNTWLRFQPNYEHEIIVSESKERGKNPENYHLLLDQVFEQIQRVLKTNRFFSFMFNSLDDNTWINIVNKLHTLDFELIKVETLEYSANSVVQDNRKQGLKTDFIITFRKNPHKERNELRIISVFENKEQIKKLIASLFSKEETIGLETYEILNKIFTYYLTRDSFFKVSEIIKFLNEEYIYKNNKWQHKQTPS